MLSEARCEWLVPRTRGSDRTRRGRNATTDGTVRPLYGRALRPAANTQATSQRVGEHWVNPKVILSDCWRGRKIDRHSTCHSGDCHRQGRRNLVVGFSRRRGNKASARTRRSVPAASCATWDRRAQALVRAGRRRLLHPPSWVWSRFHVAESDRDSLGCWRPCQASRTRPAGPALCPDPVGSQLSGVHRPGSSRP